MEQWKILDEDKTNIKDIHKLPSTKEVVEILYKVYGITQCKTNNDYDCDNRSNQQDNCPHDHNPSQKDFDQDKIGDVCDDDIDNDGIKNPKGIVDESGNTNVKKIRHSS